MSTTLAARLIGAAAAARTELGRQIHTTEADLLTRTIAELEQEIGTEAMRSEHDTGRTLGLPAATAEFVAACSHDTPSLPP